MKNWLLPVFVLIGLLPLRSQDIQYTLFNMAPMSLNPALTGAFPGTVRLGGIYRDQWGFGYLSNQFQTPSFYVDAPVFRGFGKLDWIGLGGMFLSDKAGRTGFSTNQFMISASYHWSLNKSRTTVLTIGLQGGSISRRIDIGAGNTRFFFGDELGRVIGTENQPNTDGSDRSMSNSNTNSFDLNAGLLFRRYFSDRTSMEIGFTVAHILQPKLGLLTGDPNAGGNNDGTKLGLGYVGHVNFSTAFTSQLSLTPSVFFQNTRGGGNNIQVQALLGYKLRPDSDITLFLGPGYRISDAIQVLAGVDWKALRVRASYDIALSSLANTSGHQGGLEVAAYYIITISKRPTVPPVILCPQF